MKVDRKTLSFQFPKVFISKGTFCKSCIVTLALKPLKINSLEVFVEFVISEDDVPDIWYK